MGKWRLVILLFFAAALNYGDRTAISTVFTLLRSDLGMSDVALAATSSLFLWGYAICSPLAGYAGDHLSRERLIFWSLLLWSLSTVATGLARSSAQVLACRAVLGVVESAYMPAAVGLIAVLHTSGTRAKAMGIHTAGYSFGMVVCGTLAGYLASHWGWRAPMLVLGILGLCLAAVWHLASRRSAHKPAAPARPQPFFTAVAALLRVRLYVVLLVQAALASIAMWIFLAWLPLYFTETHGLSLAAAGFAGTFWMQVGSLAGLFGGSLLSDRAAQGNVMRRMALQGGLYVLAGPVLLAFLTPQPMAVITAAVLCFFLFRYLGLANEQPLLTELLPDNLRSTAVGLTNMCNCAAGGAGVMVAGMLKKDYGLPAIFAATSVLYLLAGALLIAGFMRARPANAGRD